MKKRKQINSRLWGPLWDQLGYRLGDQLWHQIEVSIKDAYEEA